MAWGSGRVPVGINTSDSNFNTVEKTGGASTVALTTAQMQATPMPKVHWLQRVPGRTRTIYRTRKPHGVRTAGTGFLLMPRPGIRQSPIRPRPPEGRIRTPFPAPLRLQVPAAPIITCSPISSAICGSGQHNFIFLGISDYSSEQPLFSYQQ